METSSKASESRFIKDDSESEHSATPLHMSLTIVDFTNDAKTNL